MDANLEVDLRRKPKDVFGIINRAFSRADLSEHDRMLGNYFFSRIPGAVSFHQGDISSWLTLREGEVASFGQTSYSDSGARHFSVKPDRLTLGINYPGNLEFNYCWRQEDNLPVLDSLYVVNPEGEVALYNKHSNWVLSSSLSNNTCFGESAPKKLRFGEPVFGIPVEVKPYISADFDKLQEDYLKRTGLIKILRDSRTQKRVLAKQF